MTLLSRARYVLGYPLVVLMYVARAIGTALWLTSRFFGWLDDGNRIHVWYAILVAKRAVRGEPTWQPKDVLSGMQPTSARALKIARAHPDVMEVPCPCGGDKCSGVQFVPRPRGAAPGDIAALNVDLGSVITPAGMEAKAKELAGRIRDELAALERPQAAQAFVNPDFDEAESLALAGKDVPPELVLNVIRSVRGTPVVLQAGEHPSSVLRSVSERDA